MPFGRPEWLVQGRNQIATWHRQQQRFRRQHNGDRVELLRALARAERKEQTDSPQVLPPGPTT